MTGRSALWPGLLPAADHGRADLCAQSADRVRITFADGAKRLCGTSGLWNVPLGYGNRAIAEAVGEAMLSASYLGAFRYENTYARRAADALIELAGESFRRVMFSTSGGAANDLLCKVFRHAQAVRGHERRQLIVALTGSYHGLTYGSFALTGEDLGQALYRVDLRSVRHINPQDVAALDRLMELEGDRIAGVIVEPVLGTGTVPITDEFVRRLLAHRDQHGFYVAADEVATGFGRTGPMFASQEWSSPPDLLVTSKGLTNGTMAASAVILGAEIANVLESSDSVVSHAETQAGTAVSAAAVLATIVEFHRLGALANGAAVADHLDQALVELARHPLIEIGPGRGLFRTVHVHTPEGTPTTAREVVELVAAVRAVGAVVHPGPAGIQLIPALVYTSAEIDELLGIVQAGVDSWARGWHPAGVPNR